MTAGLATPPITLCEVQAYAHRAALDAAALLEAFGDKEFRDRDGEADQSGRDDARFDDPEHWRAYAAGLANAFRQRFWVSGPLGDYPALGLDGEGRPVDALTSKYRPPFGHRSAVAGRGSHGCPSASGARTLRRVRPAHDVHAGRRVRSVDVPLWLGLAARHGNRSAWSCVDGADPDARTAGAILADGLLTAAEAFDYRLPELYSGDARDEVGRPLPYPAACRPQAWSAAAGIALLQALLGLRVDSGRSSVSDAHGGHPDAGPRPACRGSGRRDRHRCRGASRHHRKGGRSIRRVARSAPRVTDDTARVSMAAHRRTPVRRSRTGERG
jgi:hypothetical protein